MRIAQLRRILVIVLGAGIFLFLLSRSGAADNDLHNAYLGELRRLREADAKLNQDILRVRYGLLPHYDSIAEGIAVQKAIHARLRDVPFYLQTDGKAAVLKALEVRTVMLREKEDLVERFKSDSAVLRNATTFLPSAVRELTLNIKEGSSDERLGRDLMRLLGDLLAYNLSGDESRAATIRKEIERVRATRARVVSELNPLEHEAILIQAEVLLTYQPRVNSAVERILSLTTFRQRQVLTETYEVARQRASVSTAGYRFALFVFVVLAVVYVASRIILTLRASAEALRIERERAETLLLNVLPEAIADRLKKNPRAIADSFPWVTVLFADLVEFTKLSEKISPTELVTMLNNIFSAFDLLAEKYGLEKIKTIGDSYMVAGGLPEQRSDHAEAVALMALEMLKEIDKFNAEHGREIGIRIGINSGPVVAGVIGIKKFIYDVWGDTVNTASRMESHGIKGRIQVSETTFELLNGRFRFEGRGSISVKGKGEMSTFFLIEAEPEHAGALTQSFRSITERFRRSAAFEAIYTSCQWPRHSGDQVDDNE